MNKKDKCFKYNMTRIAELETQVDKLLIVAKGYRKLLDVLDTENREEKIKQMDELISEVEADK